MNCIISVSIIAYIVSVIIMRCSIIIMFIIISSSSTGRGLEAYGPRTD